MTKRARRNHAPAFKAKVALERWPGSSEQRFAFDKWNHRRFPLRCRRRGVAEGGRSPTGVIPRRRRRKSCCRSLRQMGEVGVIRRSGVKTRMWTFAVIKVQIPADRGACPGDAAVSSKIDLLVFDRAPDPLDEDVVAPSPFAVHADRDGIVGQQAGERGAGELAALVGIENAIIASDVVPWEVRSTGKERSDMDAA